MCICICFSFAICNSAEQWSCHISLSWCPELTVCHIKDLYWDYRWLAVITRREFVLMGLPDCMGKFNQSGSSAFSLPVPRTSATFQRCKCVWHVRRWPDSSPIENWSRNTDYIRKCKYWLHMQVQILITHANANTQQYFKERYLPAVWFSLMLNITDADASKPNSADADATKPNA